METVEEVLNLDPLVFNAHWQEIEAIVAKRPTLEGRAKAWEEILARMSSTPASKSTPYFWLGVSKLLTDPDEAQGISCLESAYKEDEVHGLTKGLIPARMRASCLLALLKGFFEYLRSQKTWEKDQLEPQHREVLIRTVLVVREMSQTDAFNMPSFAYPKFFQLIADRCLSRFAVENYFFAKTLLELFFLRNQHIDKQRDEFPLARAVVGLLGGVLEALLADRIPGVGGKALGGLVTEAQRRGIIQTGTKLGTLSSLMLYLRNHIHPEVDAARKEFFIDINVAKGCKVALDWVMSEMLQASRLSGTPNP